MLQARLVRGVVHRCKQNTRHESRVLKNRGQVRRIYFIRRAWFAFGFIKLSSD